MDTYGTKHFTQLSIFPSQEDSHRYYTWRSFGPADKHTEDLWVDLNDPQLSQVRMHGILSNTHRQAAVRPSDAGRGSSRQPASWTLRSAHNLFLMIFFLVHQMDADSAPTNLRHRWKAIRRGMFWEVLALTAEEHLKRDNESEGRPL